MVLASRCVRFKKPLRGFSEPAEFCVAAFAGFAPFSWRSKGRAHGRDLAFLGRFAASEGLKLRVKFFDFDRLWERPARGEVDVAAGGISRRPGGETAGVTWSRPYANVRRTFLIRESDRERYRGMADFGASRLAAVRGSAAVAHALANKPVTATLRDCETLERGIDDLLEGRVDAVGTGDISARHHLSIRPGLALVDVHGDAPREDVAFSVRRNHPLRRRLNAFIGRSAQLY